MFRSIDTGNTWAKMDTPIVLSSITEVSSGYYLRSTSSPSGPAILQSSTNNGQTWTQLSVWDAPIGFFTTNSSSIFFFNHDSLCRSTDKGVTWTKTKTSVVIGVSSDPNMIAIGDTLLVGTYDGVFKTTDFGSSWQDANQGIQDLNVSAIGTADNTILVGTSFFARVYRSINSSIPWEKLFRESAQATVISDLKKIGSTLYINYTGVMDTSSDDGATRHVFRVAAGNVNALYTLGDTQFIQINNGSYRSIDNGMTWDSISGIKQIEAVIRTGSVLFCIADRSIYNSTDFGLTWGRIQTPFTMNSPNLNPSMINLEDTILFVATDSGIYKTENYGSTWTQCNSGLPKTIYLFKKFAKKDNLLFAASGDYNSYASVSYSSNNGDSWLPLNRLPDLGLSTIAVIGDYLYAGTEAIDEGWPSGLWRYPLISLSVDQKERTVWTEYKLSAFPNPVSGLTMITFIVPETALTSVSVINPLGGEHTVLPLQLLSAGPHSIQWDASLYPSGTYLCKLTSNNRTEVQKIVVTK